MVIISAVTLPSIFPSISMLPPLVISPTMFTDLEVASDYELRVYYTYDLKDGNGTQTIFASKEFNSDITGIGKYALRNFTTTSQFEEYNWKDNYKNSFFEVTVDTNVKSGFLIM